MNALNLFCSINRFDLIFKYLLAKYPENHFNEITYLESIHKMNDFIEYKWPQKSIDKNGIMQFLYKFKELIKSFKTRGFLNKGNSIPISDKNQLLNGAHRMSIAASLNIDVPINNVNSPFKENWFTYDFFQKKNLDETIADYGALEYAKLNKNAYIVNLFPLADESKDGEVLEILSQNGFVFYEKKLNLSLNGCINLKKIFYSESGKLDRWVGNRQNQYNGAQEHAKKSMNNEQAGNLRVFLFICDSIEKVRNAKENIRKIYDLGNCTVHINDTHTGTEQLAEIYFNRNSFQLLNSRNFMFDDPEFDENVLKFKDKIEKMNFSVDSFCLAGSTVLNAVGIRHSSDIDFLGKNYDEIKAINNADFHSHESQIKYYLNDKQSLIENPLYYCYYKGVKIISLKTLYDMKTCRNEIPKDVNDCNAIKTFFKA